MLSPTRRSPYLPSGGQIGAVALGGAVGGSARTWLAATSPLAAGAFPWLTLAENASGALLMGMVATVLLERRPTSRYTRGLLTTGMLGAYTTFAGLAVELVLLVQTRPLAAAAYLGATLVLGLGGVVAGIGVARSLPFVRGKMRP